jgi:hypothetical protein
MKYAVEVDLVAIPSFIETGSGIIGGIHRHADSMVIS